MKDLVMGQQLVHVYHTLCLQESLTVSLFNTAYIWGSSIGIKIYYQYIHIKFETGHAIYTSSLQ